jgi:hypothetical protein
VEVVENEMESRRRSVGWRVEDGKGDEMEVVDKWDGG